MAHKRRADILSSTPKTQKQQSFHSLGWAGWLPAEEADKYPFPITTSIHISPLRCFFLPFLKCIADSSMSDYPFPSYLPFSDSTLHLNLTYFSYHPLTPRVAEHWVHAIPQRLTTVQIWGRIKKLGNRCSKLLPQLQTGPRTLATPKPKRRGQTGQTAQWCHVHSSFTLLPGRFCTYPKPSPFTSVLWLPVKMNVRLVSIASAISSSSRKVLTPKTCEYNVWMLQCGDIIWSFKLTCEYSETHAGVGELFRSCKIRKTLFLIS